MHSQNNTAIISSTDYVEEMKVSDLCKRFYTPRQFDNDLSKTSSK